jgi:hypothetical protein
MVIVKASPRVDLRARLTPQRPPRQLDVFLLTYHAVDKNEVPHLDENGFDTQFPHHAAVIEQRYYGANATSKSGVVIPHWRA